MATTTPQSEGSSTDETKQTGGNAADSKQASKDDDGSVVSVEGTGDNDTGDAGNKASVDVGNPSGNAPKDAETPAEGDNDEKGGPSALQKALIAVATILIVVLFLISGYIYHRRRVRRRLELQNGLVYVNGSYNSLRGDDSSSMRASTIASRPFAMPRERSTRRRAETPGTMIDLISALGDDGQLPTYTPPASSDNVSDLVTRSSVIEAASSVPRPSNVSRNSSVRSTSYKSAVTSARTSMDGDGSTHGRTRAL